MSDSTFTSGGNLIGDQRLEPPPRLTSNDADANFRALQDWNYRFYQAVRLTTVEDTNAILAQILERLEALETMAAEIAALTPLSGATDAQQDARINEIAAAHDLTA